MLYVKWGSWGLMTIQKTQKESRLIFFRTGNGTIHTKALSFLLGSTSLQANVNPNYTTLRAATKKERKKER